MIRILSRKQIRNLEKFGCGLTVMSNQRYGTVNLRERPSA